MRNVCNGNGGSGLGHFEDHDRSQTMPSMLGRLRSKPFERLCETTMTTNKGRLS
jgi:hypothetical protein